MKKYFLLVNLLLIVSSGYSQNVGIGTTTPVATLDVKGNHHLGGLTRYISFDTLSGKILWTNSKLFVSTPQYIMQHSASAEGLYYGNSQLEYRESMGNPIFFTNWSNGQGYFSGKLGIGTTTPAFKLDVKNGSINTDSVYRIGTITVLSVRGTGNLLVGKNAGRINTGSNNTFSGETAGYSNTSGFGNTAYGFQALYSNINGAGNTAIGLQTLHNNIDGDANIAIGDGALFSNTGGKYNTAIGYTSLYDNIDGWYNTSNGESALTRNLTGSWNTAYGGHALSFNETGMKNTAIGYSALSQNENGTLNTGLGYNSDLIADGLTNATAIGANTRVDCSNCLVLGSVADINGATSGVNVGIGVNNPNAKLDVTGNSAITGNFVNTSINGTGVVGSSLQNAGVGWGVYGEGGSVGVEGVANLAGMGDRFGVSGHANDGTYNFGVKGDANGGTYAYGVYGSAGGATTSYGVYGAADGPVGSAWAGYFYGDVFASRMGIGTNSPAFKLDVANGSINTDSLYRIGGIPVLAIPGIGNLFVGSAAGLVNTGSENTFCGVGAGVGNTYGNYNSFFGSAAGAYNTSGSYNSFFGLWSGISNTEGYYNSFFGAGTGINNISGIENTFLGSIAGSYNTTGSYNSFCGTQAGNHNTTGSENSFFGRCSGLSNNTGNFNSFFGQSAGSGNTTGSQNSFFGRNSGFTNSVGSSNSFYGFESGKVNTTGTSNSFFGGTAGVSNTTGDFNSFFGHEAGIFNTLGSSNSFFGPAAGYFNTTGSTNSFYGLHAGYNNSSGSQNTAQGSFALLSNSTGTRNTAIGDHADVNAGALINATAIGANASVNCSNCMVLGSVTNVNGASSNINVGIGNNAPGFPLSFAPILGDKISLWSNSSNSYGFGVQGSKLQIHTDVIAADIVFGYGSSAAFTETMRIRGNGKVGIGTSTPDQALTVVGDICATGWIATCSDIRYKTNLTPISNSLEKAIQLHGLYYFLKTDEFPEKGFSDKRQIGFSAQEVEVQFPEIVQTDSKGYKSVDYSRMTPILLEAIKEQQKQIDALQKNDENQQQQINELKKLVTELATKR